MNKHLSRLHEQFGQSIWIDHLSRGWLEQGCLDQWIRRGCRGVTSNPTIFEKAFAGEKSYDLDLKRLMGGSVSMSVEQAYWEMVAHDVTLASQKLLPVHQASQGSDGFVSVEVNPALANDTEATISEAIALRQRFDGDNVLIKVPATKAGVAAMGPLISQGINLNITLIFSLERYREVAEAYIAAVEDLAQGDQPAQAAKAVGVASFFVSRVDTEVDARLEKLARDAGDKPLPQPGQAAVAQAKLAYEIFVNLFTSPRWQKLTVMGARPQRPLWASTSTKNPAYKDTLYVDSLIGPNTVNTLPESTAEAFDDHGRPDNTVTAGIEQCHQLWQDLASCGVDMDDVAKTLERQGLESFAKSFDQALDALKLKSEMLI